MVKLVTWKPCPEKWLSEINKYNWTLGLLNNKCNPTIGVWNKQMHILALREGGGGRVGYSIGLDWRLLEKDNYKK